MNNLENQGNYSENFVIEIHGKRCAIIGYLPEKFAHCDVREDPGSSNTRGEVLHIIYITVEKVI
jgi:hypothetical protein